jgi:4,5-DOPA dioxygenase extradiol
MKMPVLFVGHGNPMNAIEHNAFHAAWSALGRRLPRPRGILCVSAHWETRNAFVTATDKPETIHDFYGFPRELFNVRYPAPGDAALARRVASLVTTERVRNDPGRGLDHGAWSVLIAMYPAADIPVVQLSMDTSLPGRHHYDLARLLAPLRDESVLVVASGNIVHNLRLFSFHDARPLPWAGRCDEELRGLIAGRRHDELIEYPARHAEARLAVPTPEHYLPLLYALALQEPGETTEMFNTQVVGSISMSSVVIGRPSQG